LTGVLAAAGTDGLDAAILGEPTTSMRRRFVLDVGCIRTGLTGVSGMWLTKGGDGGSS
jgi:hypothetical protein